MPTATPQASRRSRNTLNRHVEAIALVRSFRPIPVEEFDRIARPLIM